MKTEEKEGKLQSLETEKQRSFSQTWLDKTKGKKDRNKEGFDLESAFTGGNAFLDRFYYIVK